MAGDFNPLTALLSMIATTVVIFSIMSFRCRNQLVECGSSVHRPVTVRPLHELEDDFRDAVLCRFEGPEGMISRAIQDGQCSVHVNEAELFVLNTAYSSLNQTAEFYVCDLKTDYNAADTQIHFTWCPGIRVCPERYHAKNYEASWKNSAVVE